MLRPRSHSTASAEPRRRIRLAARWTVVPLVIGVALGMIWLFPRESHTRNQALEQVNDPVATDYLRGILKQHPYDVEVRAELVQRALRSGDETTALSLLAPLQQAGPQHRLRATVLMVNILENRLRQTKPGNETHARTLAELQAKLQPLLAETDYSQLDPEWLLARVTQYLPEQLSPLYRLLAQNDPGRAPYWLERAAKDALAAGRYREAADAYFQAQQSSLDPERRKRYFLQGLITLQSGKLLKEAVAAAKQYEQPWLDDRDVLLFLTKLSRAAGDNANAERYVRRLIQMALLERIRPALQRAGWQDSGLANPSRVYLLRASNVPALPFDDEVYALAYDVFASNQKLDDALAVATAALREVPNRPDWIRRLAQAAEWSNRPEDALKAWRRLATQFNDEKGWQGMARLAPSLLADDDLLLLWHRQVARRTLDDKEWLEVQALYERLARPLDGAAFLEKEFARTSRALLLEQAAYLRQSMGDIDGTLANYRRLATTYGPRPKWAMVEASLLYSLNQPQQAFDVLNAAKSAATAENKAFWAVLGDLAWNLNQRDTAREAYRARQQADDWQRTDIDRLLDLLDESQTEERLAVSRAAWKKTGNLNYLVLALSILLEREQTAAIKTLLAEMDADKQRQAQQSADFLVLRARYFQILGNTARVRADLTEAHKLSPVAEIKSSLIWTLIDTRDAATLNGILPQWETLASGDRELTAAISAGWHALGNTQRALFWSRQLLAAHENDPIWLTDYADLVEQAGQADMAWRIRRHAWLALRTQPSTDIDTLQRQLRLTLSFEQVDQAEKRLYQALLAGRSLIPGSGTPERDAALVNELAYAWMMGQDDDNRARFWHWRRYARKLADPNYLALRAASLREDRTTQQILLERNAIAIQPSDHTVAATETGETKVAEEQAWNALDGSPANDALHMQMSDLVLAGQPSNVGIKSEHFSGELSGWHHTFANRLMLTPSTSLSVDLSRADQKYAGSGYSQNTREIVMTLSKRLGNEDTLSLAAGRHLGWTPYNSLLLRDEGRYGRWRFAGEAGWNRPMNDNALLALAGMQQELALEAGYQIGQNLAARLRLSHARILAQDEEFLGRRNQLDASLDWASSYIGGYTLSLAAQRANYAAANKALNRYSKLLPEEDAILASDILPQSFGRVSLTAGYGLAYKEGYTRAWRPFWSGTIGTNTVSGLETGWLLGIAGSALGNDHLSIYSGRSVMKSGSNSSFGSVFYQWFY